jgi:DNA invertase Pin-like site-specific DNA recombinase
VWAVSRISSDGQTLEAQLAALKAAGCSKTFSEKVSGVVTDRKALAKAIDALSKGDTLIVTRLDRLARSTKDLLNTLDAIAKKGAGFKSLANVWADTTTPHGRLMLVVLGGLAEFERDLIRARTSESKANGMHMGRPLKLTAHQQQEARDRFKRGDTLVEIAKTYDVSHTTISRLMAR